MNKIVLLSVLNFMFLVFSNNVFANNTDKFEFTRDYVEGIGMLKSSFVDGANVLGSKYDNETEKGIAILKNFESQIYNLKMSEDLLKKYQNSDDDLIKKIVKNTLFIYETLIDINKKSSEGFKKMYSPEVINNPSQFDQGEEMGKVGKLQAAQEQALLILIDSSKLVPGVLISKVPGEEGKMNYLVITLEQRNEILQKLLNDFGDKLKVKKEDFKSAGLQTIDLSGWVIYNTLSQPYKTVEFRPKGFIEPNKIQ